MALSGRNLVVLSGASRGIGREIAMQMAEKSGEKSVFVLTARDEKLLEEVKAAVHQRCTDSQVTVVTAEMGNFDEKSQDAITQAVKTAGDLGPFDAFYLIHNAGTVGDVSKPSIQLNDAADWHNYLEVNLISMIQLNSIVLKEIDDKLAKKRYIVNITSLVALKGFPSLCQYSVGKAARECFFRVLASENEKDSLRVLSYSPGPVDTQMPDIIAANTYDKDLQAAFSRDASPTDVKREMLSPKQTVGRLVGILEKDEFENGGRIDYFDK